MCEEHSKNARRSSREKHEEGQARKGRDAATKAETPAKRRRRMIMKVTNKLSDRINHFFKSSAWLEARKLLEAERKKDPDNHWLITQLGVTFYEQKQYTKALRLFLASQKIVPDCPLTLWNLAGTLDALGKHNSAIRIYTSLLQSKTSSEQDPCWESQAWSDALKTDCCFRLGDCYRHLGKRILAEHWYRQYLDLLLLGSDGTYSVQEVTEGIKALHGVNGLPANGRAKKAVQSALAAAASGR
jgi:tetratricopeptide (TPR) repeat protein